tara:strand:- start:3107 stop:4102 length:996 start_codon:yes stop_codon:yes gene_type:complete
MQIYKKIFDTRVFMFILKNSLLLIFVMLLSTVSQAQDVIQNIENANIVVKSGNDFSSKEQAQDTVDISKPAILNVINNLKKAKIIVNGNVYDQNRLFNLELEPGSHFLEVKVKKDIVYSKIIELKSGQTLSVDTSYKVGGVAKSVQKKAVKTIKKRRGTTAFGFQLQSVSGISIKKYVGPLGIQVTGFSSSSSYDDYTSSEYTDDSDYGLNCRIIFNLKEKLLFGNSLARYYVGVGYGVDTYDNNEWSYSFDEEYYNTYKEVAQIFMGVEFDLPVGSYSFGFEYRIKDITRDVYSLTTYNWDSYSYDSTYERDVTSQEQGILLNFGYHFYF